ncbi:MAG: OB-fold nucleic acid binding domain-containing protein [Candidatus Methanoperedenaceae archaeon]|nr:OB-fold nucleic acid binding domain-containing protein [Euryarchaeota archaeon]MCG2727892.1 OB-fold nucleic acid binding domain-containing protein [Candidatus Methanoperedenaceae archaeon]
MVVLLIMSVLSLIIGYFGFSSQTAAYSSDSKIGERVYVEGTILSIQKTGKGDHLILKLSNLNVNVFVPKNNGAKEVYNLIKKDDRVRITGKVDVFNDKREIVVESAKDVVRI